MRWAPDALSYTRVVLTLATYPVALAGWMPAFGVLVLFSVITDVLDGPIARRLGVATERGANLDSAADFLFYASLPIWTFAFRPDVVREILWEILLFFALYVAVNVASRLKRGVMGFHNRWTRSAGTLGVVVALWTILWGLNPVLHGALIAILVLDLLQRTMNLVRRPPERTAGPSPPNA